MLYNKINMGYWLVDSDWEPHFAWIPVYVDDEARFVWLGWCYRRWLRYYANRFRRTAQYRKNPTEQVS